MKWIRNYFKRMVIRWLIEDIRNNGELRQLLKPEVHVNAGFDCNSKQAKV